MQNKSVTESQPVISSHRHFIPKYWIIVQCRLLTSTCVCVCARAPWRLLPSMPLLPGERLEDTSSSQPLLTHRTSCRGWAASKPAQPAGFRWRGGAAAVLRFYPITAYPDVFSNPPRRDCHYSPAPPPKKEKTCGEYHSAWAHTAPVDGETLAWLVFFRRTQCN